MGYTNVYGDKMNNCSSCNTEMRESDMYKVDGKWMCDTCEFEYHAEPMQQVYPFPTDRP